METSSTYNHSSSKMVDYHLVSVDESYQNLPSLYLVFMSLWFLSSFSWTLHTWSNRSFQVSKLRWMLASVPVIKTLQLSLSFSFWYSCTKLEICSLWISFGVYVTGVLFQTASVVSFMVISHGYCIMYDRLSLPQRRKTAALGCFLYLALAGYKAALPYFSVLLLLNYSLSFYTIFQCISQNLFILRNQLDFIADEDMQAMHYSLSSTYRIFKKFQVAMQAIALVEILVYMTVHERPEGYYFRLLCRESAQFCTFLYIGWTFRTKESSQHFFVFPTRQSWENKVPPIYRMEMNAKEYKNWASQELHVGVPTSFPSLHCKSNVEPLFVVIQHPRATESNAAIGSTHTALRVSNNNNFSRDCDHV